MEKNGRGREESRGGELEKRGGKKRGRVGEQNSKERKEEKKKISCVNREKDGPRPGMVSDTLCPAVHILGT